MLTRCRLEEIAKGKNYIFQRRSDEYNYGDDQRGDKSPRIDGKPDPNQYGHERRNTSDIKDQIHVLNATDFNYEGYGAGNSGEKYVNSIPRPANGGSYNDTNYNRTMNRTKRNEPLLNKDDGDKVLIPSYIP